MTQGLKALRKIQIGKETNKGSAVAATAKLDGALTMKPGLNVGAPQGEEVGALTKSIRSYVAGKSAAMKFTGDVLFEQILYFLLMGIKGGVTGTQQGGTAAYLWVFEPSLLISGAQNSFTLEYGDNLQAFEAEYCMASSIQISGAPGEALKLEVEIFGRQVSDTTFTASLDLPAELESALFNMMSIYIDDTWAGIGTTQLEEALLGFTLKFDTGLVPLVTADGQLYFATNVEKARGAELDKTLAFNTAVNTERAKWESQTPRAIRLKSLGSLISGSYYKQLTIDLWGRYSDWDTLGEKDGADVIAVKVASLGDITNNHEIAVAVQNKVSVLP